MKERERGTFLHVSFVVVHRLSIVPTENVVVLKQLSQSVVSKHFSHLCFYQLFQFPGHFTQVSNSFRKRLKIVGLQPFCQDKKDDGKKKKEKEKEVSSFVGHKVEGEETFGQIGIWTFNPNISCACQSKSNRWLMSNISKPTQLHTPKKISCLKNCSFFFFFLIEHSSKLCGRCLSSCNNNAGCQGTKQQR